MRFVLSILLMFTGMYAHAFGQQKGYAAEFAFNHNGGFQTHQLGTKVIRDTVHDVMVAYDFAIDGGAITTLQKMRMPKSPGGVSSASATLPKGAVVIGCYIDVITPLTTSASGTMALSTGQAAGDLKAALAAASYTGIVACIPVGTAATAIKLTADSVPYYAIATGAITAGKLNLHIQYVLSDL